MTLDDLVVVDLDGNVVAGTGRPRRRRACTSPRFAAYPEVGGVVHCHATHASMYAVAHRPIPAAIDEFVVYIGGDVPVGDYQPSGSDGAVGRGRQATSPTARPCSWPTTGWWPSASRSTTRCTPPLVVEHNAQIMWGAQQLGGVVRLPHKDVKDFTGVYRYVREQTWMPA